LSEPAWLSGICGDCGEAYRECICGGALRAENRHLRGEVERLQRFEAMWEECKQHRNQAEKRARRYMDIVQQVAKLVAPDEDDLA
jgi:hypothetical protein